MVQVKFLNIITTYTDICKIRGYTSIDWQYRIRIQNASSKVKESCYHFTIYVIVVLGEDCNTEIKEKKILFFFPNNLFPVIFYIFKQVQPLDYRTPAVLRWISCHIMTYVFVFPFLIFLKIYRNYKYFC